MKYLKLYEAAFEALRKKLDEEAKNIVEIRSLINWDLINDAKDMALEHIDEGLTFIIIVNVRYGIKDYRIYRLMYNHNKTDEDFTRSELISNICDFYKISNDDIRLIYDIFFISTLQRSSQDPGMKLKIIKANRELKERIKEAYPKENIQTK